MHQHIVVTTKVDYGVERIYPVCENAQIFAAISGQKTLSLDNIERIKSLGFGVKEEQRPSLLSAVLSGDKAAQDDIKRRAGGASVARIG